MKFICKCMVLLVVFSFVSFGHQAYTVEDVSTTYTLAMSPYDVLYLTLNPIFDSKNDFTRVIAVEATLEVELKDKAYKGYKVIVDKDDVEYIYNLVEPVTRLPLQLGDGHYAITLLGSDDGRRYRTLNKTSFDVVLEEDVVFLNSSQTVYYTEDDAVVTLAKALTEDLEDQEAKLRAIHTYVVEHVRYDYKKAENLPKGYIPKPTETLEGGGGICYDYSALLGAMLRSVDVPTKLIKGYSTYTPVYHAWNEVLIDGEWWVVDSSTDAIYYDYKVAYDLKKAVKDYQTTKFY